MAPTSTTMTHVAGAAGRLLRPVWTAKHAAQAAGKALPTSTTSLLQQFSASAAAAAMSRTLFKLPDLTYDYAALEPAISAKIMETHHSKHHQTYVTNLNNAIQQYAEAEQKGDLTKQIALQGALRFHGGGHLNHSIFWTNLAPVSQGGGAPPTGALLKAIERDFGTFDNLKAKLSAASVGVQGSGWGWLGYNPQTCRIEIITKPNQDPLTEAVPLLGIDVWEHAYYYVYGPQRAEYLKQIWSVVNWKNVAERYEAAVKA